MKYNNRHSRSRSRERNKRTWRREGSRSSSSSNQDKSDQRNRRRHDKSKKKRVKQVDHLKTGGYASRLLPWFVRDEELLNVKIFRKDDEPSAKPLTNSDLMEIQMKMERQNRCATYLINSEELKHRESLMEGDAMKKYKEKQKSFNQKLMMAREEISYYAPPLLKVVSLPQGQNSNQKEAHNQRINSTLGCFYSKINQIPDCPAMNNIINNVPSTQAPKTIAFQQTSREQVQQISKFTKTEERQKVKPLKGILKRSIQQISRMRQRQLEQKYRRDHQNTSPKFDPVFLKVIEDISTNKLSYTHQQVQEKLKPYKQNGMLEQYLKKITAAKEAAAARPAPVMQPMRHPTMPATPAFDFNVVNKPMMPVMPPVRADKFKTIPCKYYHGPLGCQKREGCTFIHDESYPGIPTPGMHKYVKGMEAPPGGYTIMPKLGMPMNNRMYGPAGALMMGATQMPVGSSSSMNINLNNNSGMTPNLNGMGVPPNMSGNGTAFNINNLNPNNMTHSVPMSYGMGPINPDRSYAGGMGPPHYSSPLSVAPRGPAMMFPMNLPPPPPPPSSGQNDLGSNLKPK